MTDLSDLVGEYTSSEHFLFIDPALKPDAETLLAYWCDTVGSDFSAASMERAFKKIAALDLPLEVRKSAPRLVKEFLSFAGTTGRNPQAVALIDTVTLIEKQYRGNFRDDGSFRGETVTKKHSDVGRNDPCPCGSGRKFKQCCMKLIA